MTRRTHWLAWGIIALALVVRLAAVGWLADTVPYSDAAYYHLAAQKMAADWRFAFDRAQAEYYGRLGWWPPLYPAFLSVIYRVTGVDHRAAVFVQALLGALVVALVYRLGRRAAGTWAGAAAALLVALDPTYVFLTNILASENLYVLWLVLGLWFAGRWLARPATAPEGRARNTAQPAPFDAAERRAAILAGVAFGLGALTRAIGLLVPVVVAVASRAGAARRRWLIRSAWVVGASALVIAPWTLRNAVVAGSPALVCFGGGLNFYFGHNPSGLGYRDLAQTPMSKLGSQAAIDAMGYRLGFEHLGRAPLGFFTRGVRKVGELFGSASYAPHSNSAIMLPDGWQTDPVKRQQAEALRARQRDKNRWLDGLFSQLANLHTILLGLGTLAACLRWRRLPAELRVLVWLCLYWIGAHIVFWAQPRFRYPMEIPMALLAGFAVSDLLRRTPAAARRASGLALVALLAWGCAATSYPPPPPVEPWGDSEHPYDDPIEVAATNALGPRPFEFERLHRPAIRLADFYLLTSIERDGRVEQARELASDAESWRRLRGVDSLPLYLEAVRLDPSFAAGWVQAARIAFERGSTRRAHALAAQGLRLDWGNAQAWYLMAGIYMREDDDARARAALEYSLALDPGAVPEAAKALTVLYVRAGEIARADSLVRRMPSSVDKYMQPYLEGVRAREGGDLEAALVSFRQAGRDSLAPAGVLVDLGNAEQAAGNFEAAEESYRRALHAEPGLPAALLGLGVVERSRGDVEAACATFSRLVERNPKHAEAQFNLGSTALEIAQRSAPPRRVEMYAIAESAFAASAELGFRTSEARLWRAEARLGSGDARGAYEQARELVADRELSVPARWLAARAAHAAGQPQSVVQLLAPAHRAESLDADGLDLLGNTYLELQRPGDAVPVLQAALEKHPDDWRTAVNLGIALARTDRLAEAEALLRPFANRYPNEPIILQNLAAVLQRLGKRAEALGLLERADELRRP